MTYIICHARIDSEKCGNAFTFKSTLHFLRFVADLLYLVQLAVQQGIVYNQVGKNRKHKHTAKIQYDYGY